MQCFQHAGNAAVGICRGCGKGVCAAPCARDSGHGLACSDACEQRIGIYESLNRRAGASYGTATRNLWLGPSFFGVMGALFVYFGLRDRELFNFATALGGAFGGFAIIFLLRNLVWARAMKQVR